MSATQTRRFEKVASVLSLKAAEPKAVSSWLYALGIVEVCGRCIGSGRHSYNQRDGDRCFGCGGSGKRAVKSLTVAHVERVKEALTSGEVEAVRVRSRNRKAAKRELQPIADSILKLWKDCGLAARYCGADRDTNELGWVVTGDNQGHFDSPLFRANSLMGSLFSETYQLASDAIRTGKDPVAALNKARECYAIAEAISAHIAWR